MQIESVTMRHARAQVFGDAAVAPIAAENKSTDKRKPTSEKSRGIDFLVNRDGRWQVLNSQITTIKK